MKDRIRQIMESQHMTQQTFASFIGMSAASLSSIFNERTKPTLNTVEAIRAKIPAINLEWLMFGKGPMYTDQAPADNPPAATEEPRRVAEPTLDFGPIQPASSTPQSASRPAMTDGGMTRRPTFEVKASERPRRQITEIRVFYDDQTWESFVPKK